MISKNLVKSQYLKTAVLIYLFSLFVNSYKLPQNLFFGHEQGRDAQAVKEIYTGKHFPLISTKTEVEGLYSPPWYYYIMTIPYGLTGGNPTAGMLAIIFFNSTAAAVMYFFIKDLTNSNFWGIVGGLLTTLSWEFINYARWLINVSPAYPFVTLALYMAWKYYKTKAERYFFLYALFAIIAFQFQITLIFQFAFLSIVLIVFRFFKIPNVKTILLAAVTAILFISPLIIFDFRHEHISLKSIASFMNGTASTSLNIHPQNSLSLYLDQFLRVAKRTLFDIKNTYLQLTFFIFLLIGFFLFLKDKSNRKSALFVLVISFMSLGIMPFNIGLTQLYQGTGVGLIALATVSFYALWKKFKIGAFLLTLLLIASSLQNVNRLQKNDDLFFVPEQKVLTLRDQQNLINFMHTDAQIKPYRFESQTIPYLHSEGWQYLHSYMYPHAESKVAKEVYISIEKNIEPYWEKKWIEDLGETELIYEKNFGQIRLQKRLIKTQ